MKNKQSYLSIDQLLALKTLVAIYHRRENTRSEKRYARKCTVDALTAIIANGITNNHIPFSTPKVINATIEQLLNKQARKQKGAIERHANERNSNTAQAMLNGAMQLELAKAGLVKFY